MAIYEPRVHAGRQARSVKLPPVATRKVYRRLDGWRTGPRVDSESLGAAAGERASRTRRQPYVAGRRVRFGAGYDAEQPRPSAALITFCTSITFTTPSWLRSLAAAI